jgi:hypothetical protein
MKEISIHSLLTVLAFYSCSDSGVLQEATPGFCKSPSERLLRIDKMVQQAIDSGWTAGATVFIAVMIRLFITKLSE